MSKLDVDKNLVLTACLLCNCKKVENAQNIESVHTYAKRGAEYLATLGFEKTFVIFVNKLIDIVILIQGVEKAIYWN